MEFKEREVRFPGQKKLIKVNPETGFAIEGESPVYVKIEREEGTITESGTPINAANLNKGNWRDDDSLSFMKLSHSNIGNVEAGVNGSKIVTLANGETWLIPPSGLSKPAGRIVSNIAGSPSINAVNTSANVTNYIKYDDGTMICFGRFNNALSAPQAISFGQTFSVVPTVFFTWNNATTGTNVADGIGWGDVVTFSQSTTGFSMYRRYANRGNPAWMAIGRWK